MLHGALGRQHNDGEEIWILKNMKAFRKGIPMPNLPEFSTLKVHHTAGFRIKLSNKIQLKSRGMFLKDK